jgi:hypothetical protein
MSSASSCDIAVEISDGCESDSASCAFVHAPPQNAHLDYGGAARRDRAVEGLERENDWAVPRPAAGRRVVNEQ